ncbi:MAG TPA: SDR family NAD(P)-dependent oxidoreductase [Candidatus Wunengus sp. YC65]|uniref:SDR family NAD(P)-dependent oxidoreductase n=1 Tax=Candidatus Wunengus sp. YC65 TaxID=3367701 RepID=UPI0040272EDB
MLVTGASGGIGRVLVKELFKQGACVGAHYYKNKPDVKEILSSTKANQGGNIYVLKADLRDNKETQNLFKGFVDWAGGIDGLVNNAGDVNIRTHFLEVDEPAIEADWTLNLKAPFWLSRYAIKYMEKNGIKGSIVNISSIAAKFGGSPQTLFYGLAKSALETMTFSLGRYCAPLGIRVNALRLGVFDTPFHQRHVKDLSERIKLIPAKRMGNPEEATWWVMCLLHEKSAYMSGQIISLTGGE